MQENTVDQIVVALAVEAAGLFAIAGAITMWTRAVLRAN